VTGIVYSPANHYLAYLTSNEVGSADLVIKEHTTLATVITIKNIESDSQIAFTDNENFVFIKDKSNDVIARIISLPDKLDILSKSISALPIYKLAESGDQRELYAISDNGLFKINIVDKTIELIIKGQIQDVIELDQSIYYIEKKNDLSVLSKTDKNDLNNINEILTFSNKGIYSLSKTADSYINMHDTKNQELSLIRVRDQFSFNLNKLNPDVSSFAWSPDKSLLMLYNDFEIWSFDPESDQQELLIRSGSVIKFADWSPDGKWIIYSNDGYIRAIELDGRGKRNIVNLVESDFAPFSVNKNTKVMFYHDASQHLYRKSIQ
jgi:Tol biopolymer transport system component